MNASEWVITYATYFVLTLILRPFKGPQNFRSWRLWVKIMGFTIFTFIIAQFINALVYLCKDYTPPEQITRDSIRAICNEVIAERFP